MIESFIMIARESPRVEIYPHEPQTVRIGESAMLSCRAIAGIPTPTLVWVRRDGSPLMNAEEKYPGTILISNITFAESGEYECRASNIAGAVSQTASIRVQQPPQIRILPEMEELTITEGDELKLECFAEGTPSPNVEWMLPSQGPTPFGLPAAPPSSDSPRGSIHKYNVDRSAEGLYVCHAKNEAGEDQKYITVIVQQKRGDVGKFMKDYVLIYQEITNYVLTELCKFFLIMLHK